MVECSHGKCRMRNIHTFRSSPDLLPSFQQRLEEQFQVSSNVLAPLVLPFDHSSGDKPGARAG